MSLTEYRVRLVSDVSRSFRCQRAADSLDIDAAKKAVHELSVRADLATPYHVGLLLGASGSGKTTLARAVFGDDALETTLDLARPVIDQFPEAWSYDECAAALAGVGLTSVPCWIRPAVTLSNGQRARAEAALQMARMAAGDVVVIDEWTSVVDRTVAKVMSYCIAKHARRVGARVVLCSCHYDVVDWLNPDWVIDCNRAEYVDRRAVQPGFRRDERLAFSVREVDRTSWRFFSKYHYLSDRLPGGFIRTYGLFHGDDQIGFQCFANYVPARPGRAVQMHSNRTVVHPDYAGLGLGIQVINVTSAHMARAGFDVRAKFSSAPVYRAMARQSCWRFTSQTRQLGRMQRGGTMDRDTGFRENVTTYHFAFDLAAYAALEAAGRAPVTTPPAAAAAPQHAPQHASQHAPEAAADTATRSTARARARARAASGATGARRP